MTIYRPTAVKGVNPYTINDNYRNICLENILNLICLGNLFKEMKYVDDEAKQVKTRHIKFLYKINYKKNKNINKYDKI